MRLNDPLITFFIYENRKYDIDLAFDNVLDVFDVLNNKYLRDHEKIKTSLELLLDEQEHTPSVGLWNYIFENFITEIADEPVRYDLKGNPLRKQISNNNESNMCIDQDAKYIYASFKQAYNIDLFEQQGKMHWDTFRSLLNGLPSNTIMQIIRQIREWKPSKGDSAEHKKQMKELQKVYELRDGSEVD